MRTLIIFFVSILLWYIFKDNNLNNRIEKFENQDTNSKLSFPIYWINLDRSIDRREFMENQFKKYGITNHTRISAVDGSKLDDNFSSLNTMCLNEKQKEEYIKLLKKRNIKPEIGAVFSHLFASKQAFNNGDEYAIIIEDDIDFKYMHKWNFSLKELVNEANKEIPKWEILQLHISGKDAINNLLEKKNKFVSWEPWMASAGMYIINKKAMNHFKNIINNCETFLELNKINFVADEVMFNKFTYTYTKPLVISFLGKSLIHDTEYNNEYVKSGYDVIRKYFES